VIAKQTSSTPETTAECVVPELDQEYETTEVHGQKRTVHGLPSVVPALTLLATQFANGDSSLFAAIQAMGNGSHSG
jgi:hypothetical protein